MKPSQKLSAWKLKCYDPLSSVAFKFNLRRYNMVDFGYTRAFPLRDREVRQGLAALMRSNDQEVGPHTLNYPKLPKSTLKYPNIYRSDRARAGKVTSEFTSFTHKFTVTHGPGPHTSRSPRHPLPHSSLSFIALKSVSDLVPKVWYRIPFDQSELSLSNVPPADSPDVRPVAILGQTDPRF
jgi:hypothetical protein